MRYVIKISGKDIAGVAQAARFVRDGAQVVVVHGAGPQLDAALSAAGIATPKVGGLRTTPPEAIPVITRVMATVGLEVAAHLQAQGVPASRLGPPGPAVLDGRPVEGLGRVGSPTRVHTGMLQRVLEAGRVPVVTPLAYHAAGALNVNADEAAAALAVAWDADELLLCSDVPGLLLNQTVVERLTYEEAIRIAPEIEGGMRPKLLAAATVAKAGHRARILRSEDLERGLDGTLVTP